MDCSGVRLGYNCSSCAILTSPCDADDGRGVCDGAGACQRETYSFVGATGCFHCEASTYFNIEQGECAECPGISFQDQPNQPSCKSPPLPHGSGTYKTVLDDSGQPQRESLIRGEDGNDYSGSTFEYQARKRCLHVKCWTQGAWGCVRCHGETVIVVLPCFPMGPSIQAAALASLSVMCSSIANQCDKGRNGVPCQVRLWDRSPVHSTAKNVSWTFH